MKRDEMFSCVHVLFQRKKLQYLKVKEHFVFSCSVSFCPENSNSTFHLCTNFTWVIFASSNKYLYFLFVSVLSASFYCCEDKGDVFESC